jgi:phage gp46-like protein
MAFALTIRPDPACPDTGLFGWDTIFNNDNATTDWAHAGAQDALSNAGGLRNIAALATSVQNGLYTDRLCPVDHPLVKFANGDRRGWWGDAVLLPGERPMGGLLWLLENSIATPDTLRWAEALALDALSPLLEDDVCADMTAKASPFPSLEGIYLQINLYAADGTKIFDRRYELNWRQIIPVAIGVPRSG